MIAALLARFGLGSFGLKGLAWLGLATVGLIFAVWLSTKLYMAGVYAERIKMLEATVEQVKADLASNEAIRRQAEADAAKSETDAQKLKELLDELQNTKSCPLTREHINGLRRIDNSP